MWSSGKRLHGMPLNKNMVFLFLPIMYFFVLESRPTIQQLCYPNNIQGDDRRCDQTGFAADSNTRQAINRPIRVLHGILTMDSPTEEIHRNKFRDLFAMEPHRVCTLYEFQLHRPAGCELIYTFVMGTLSSENDTTIPTENLDETARPFLVEKDANAISSDINNTDIIQLNIKENMNDGKSTSWFAFALSMQKKFGFDYAVKTDSDSMPILDKYFSFTKHSLAPAPYNRNILAGLIVDKHWWPKKLVDKRKERFFRQKYGGFHVYVAGEWYLMSPDLMETVVQEAPNAGSYAENHEDHDVSAMAAHSDRPLQLITIGPHERHWVHGLKVHKGENEFHTAWSQELDRYREIVSDRQNNTAASN